MKLNDLRQISHPAQLPSDHLRAMWYDLNGDWDTAHSIVQAMADAHAMWIHAYLHRKEPDEGNAKYWYLRAGVAFPGDISYEAEAATLLSVLVS